MDMEEHFQSQEVVKFKLDGVDFEYKPVTAGDELSWIHDCMVTDKKTEKKYQSQELVTKCKFKNLLEASYTKDIIKSIIGHEKTWKELSHDEKWNLLRKMKVTFFDKLLLKMKAIDEGNSSEKEEKKN